MRLEKKSWFALALSALAMGGLTAAPIPAHADDPGKGGKKDGKKGGDIPIVIGAPTIVHDPPKKK